MSTVARALRTIPEQLFRGSAGWAGIMEVLQVISSVAVFVVLGNVFDEPTYGVMSGVLSLAIISLGFANLGTHILLLRRTSQDADSVDAWRRALSLGFVGPALGAAALIAFQPLLLPNVDSDIYMLFVVGNMPLFWICELTVHLGVGLGRMKQAAMTRAIVVICRVAAVVWFVIFGNSELVRWAAASSVSFAVGAVLALMFVWKAYGLAPRIGRFPASDMVDGVPYSTNSVTESLVDQSDRWLLVRYGLEADNGIYSLGGRIMQFGYLPLRVIMRTNDRALFAAGKHGLRPALRVTARMSPTIMAIAVAVAIGAFVFAPIIPNFVGEKFSDDEIVASIRLLSVLPIFRAGQYLFGNTLSAADHQWSRLGATAVAFLVNLGLNVRFLPGGSWRTAVYTTFVSELILLVLLAVIVARWWARGAPSVSEGGDR